MIHALIGLGFAVLTRTVKARFALPLGLAVLWLVPYLWYWMTARQSAAYDEYAAWSLLFIAPAAMAAWLALALYRLVLWINTKRAGR